MKKIYLKPVAEEESQLSAEEIMITASVDGNSLLNDGGNTNDCEITEGDSRLQHSVWDE